MEVEKDHAPFTDNELKLFQKVSGLYGEFRELESLGDSHPSDHQEMVSAVHNLQDILIKRVARREWPGSFVKFKSEDGKFRQEF